jgi:hypothetical protein
MSMFRATSIPFLNDERKTLNQATPWRGIAERDGLFYMISHTEKG